jgi:integrase
LDQVRGSESRDSAGARNFRFHDLRHTFPSWYMMNGSKLYALAKILPLEHQED